MELTINTEKETADILDAFIKVAPYLNSLVQDDITIGIYDTEKLLVNIPAKTFSLNVKAGDPLQEGDIITDAIRSNQKKTSMVPKELFGFPLIDRGTDDLKRRQTVHEHCQGRAVRTSRLLYEV